MSDLGLCNIQSLFYLLKIWTSVIIAVLILLPLILTSVPVSTAFSPSLWDILSGFFAYLVIFYWMSDEF